MDTISKFIKDIKEATPGTIVEVPKGIKPQTLEDLIKEALIMNEQDVVNHPKHYTQHPSGVECIQITEHMNFCLGNAIKYIWRAGLKKQDPMEDLKKARFYIEREIKRLGGSL